MQGERQRNRGVVFHDFLCVAHLFLPLLCLQELRRRIKDLQTEVERLNSIIKGLEKDVRDRDEEIEVSLSREAYMLYF